MKTIMIEIGEEMNDRELNEMIKATGTLDGKGLFSEFWIFRFYALYDKTYAYIT